ncbi:MAG: hypothetical protein JO077_19875 [Verrucomicrobia bacterium]|nr:hypothetical protein [Verrucomicrobiota bacterium]
MSLPFAMHDAAAQAYAKVLTPFGYMDGANVHQVPTGYELVRMPDEHMRMENPTTGDHIDFPKPVSLNKPTIPFTDNGWVTFASWYNDTGTPVAYYVADWNVPPAPSTYDGQTIFLFNSIEPASGNAILQPVLQYGTSAAGGGEYWSVASWYVFKDNQDAYVTPLTYVSPGQFLGGQISLIKKKRALCTYKSDFYGIDASILTVRDIRQLVWCTGTLEVYGLDQCTDFPNTAYTEMYSVNIVLTNGYAPSMQWTVTNAATSCGVQTGIGYGGAVNAILDIYY